MCRETSFKGSLQAKLENSRDGCPGLFNLVDGRDGWMNAAAARAADEGFSQARPCWMADKEGSQCLGHERLKQFAYKMFILIPFRHLCQIAGGCAGRWVLFPLIPIWQQQCAGASIRMLCDCVTRHSGCLVN